MIYIRDFGAKTLSWWYNERDNIDFMPPFQRNGNLWSIDDKAFLIDTILNNYDIPKIYIADFTRGNNLYSSNRKYAIIDGKQRFETIFDFFDDKFSLSETIIYVDDESIDLSGLKYSELRKAHPYIAGRFENFGLTVMSVESDNIGNINDIFIRLNNSKPLTEAEIRDALTGKIPDLIRKIRQHDIFSRLHKFSDNRKESSDIASKILVLAYNGRITDLYNHDIKRFINDAVNAEFEDYNMASDKALSILDSIYELKIHEDTYLNPNNFPFIYFFISRNLDNKKYINQFLSQFFGYVYSKAELPFLVKPALSSEAAIKDFRFRLESIEDKEHFSIAYQAINIEFGKFCRLKL